MKNWERGFQPAEEVKCEDAVYTSLNRCSMGGGQSTSHFIIFMKTPPFFDEDK